MLCLFLNLGAGQTNNKKVGPHFTFLDEILSSPGLLLSFLSFKKHLIKRVVTKISHPSEHI